MRRSVAIGLGLFSIFAEGAVPPASASALSLRASDETPSYLLRVQRNYRDPLMSTCQSDDVPSDRAIAACSRAIGSGKLNNVGMADAHFYRGYEYARTGEPEKAMADFTAAIGYLPNYQAAYFNRAYLHLLKRDYSALYADAEKAATLGKNQIDSQILWWIALTSKGGWAESLLPSVEQYVKNNYKPEAYFVRAEILKFLNRYEEALYDYLQALTMDPKIENRLRAVIELSLLEMVSRPASRDDASPGKDSEPPGHRDRDECEILNGDEGIAACGRAIGSNQFSGMDLAKLHQVRGYERYNKNDLDGALADFSAVIKINPKAVFAHEYRGHVHAKRGRPADAKADYERALQNGPDSEVRQRIEQSLLSLK